MFNKLFKLYTNNYHLLYVGLLSMSLVSMPHSRALLSSSQIALAAFWILDVNFILKFKSLFGNKAFLFFVSIFFLHIVGLLYTSNYSFALKDLRVKLPLLLYPIVIASSAKLSYKEVKFVFTVFSISVFLKTLYGLALILGLTGTEIANFQHISGKMSHIRFSLILNIIIFSNIYFLFITSSARESKIFFFFRSFLIIWMFAFLLILHSVTGWVIFFILLVFTILFATKNSLIKYKRFIIYFGSVISISIILYLFFSVKKYYKTDKIDKETIEWQTKSGNKYKHNFKSLNTENGHFVNLYICKKELKKTWNKVSYIDYNGKDKKQQNIRYTLIRYLTSKNLRKDKEGVLQLSSKDISNIENGMTNYIFENRFALYPKIYEVLWQIDKYINHGSIEGHSVTQRFEFLKVAKKIIKDNFWFGVGTGDVGDEFTNEYKNSDTKLHTPYRLRTHNQFVTFFVTFGFFGFIWFLVSYFYPVFINKKWNDYLFLISFFTISLSMLNEDTTETQMGATIFAFFISFLLFNNYYEENKKRLPKISSLSHK